MTHTLCTWADILNSGVLLEAAQMTHDQTPPEVQLGTEKNPWAVCRILQRNRDIASILDNELVSQWALEEDLETADRRSGVDWETLASAEMKMNWSKADPESESAGPGFLIVAQEADTMNRDLVQFETGLRTSRESRMAKTSSQTTVGITRTDAGTPGVPQVGHVTGGELDVRMMFSCVYRRNVLRIVRWHAAAPYMSAAARWQTHKVDGGGGKQQGLK
ncbi:hypothetical protein LX32DRAFT_656753 [Colletotrichum zoysiae]|uniref:Uncharacterized protein n=1 Tax=Colletotrichum zoysiae TaxID=1216348 RepID=A0AAD9H754_9PEZI|nr:hypothetical protein LX32DRAFT_656753 [Colletotrichum zoysiae]